MTTVIVRTAARVLTPVMFLFSLYLLSRGHHAPGGGFIGAIVAGLATLFRGYALGFHELDIGRGRRPAYLLAAGLLVALGTGTAGWWWGEHFLEAASVRVDPPLVGSLELSSPLLFEVGVYLTVLGAITAIIVALGEEQE